ncbi:MAG: hypothetical protein MJ151_04870, partial [Lachnospiraceae bacterium]|nr:hypothetical protein [Lachnospiraceae bacterium]
IFILMFHAIIEGYFDVYEAEFQRQHLLYKAGFALFVRSIGWALIFIAVLYITKNLLISAIIGMCVKFYLGYTFETKKSKHLFIDESDIKVDVIKTIEDITIEILPVFLMVFLDNFIYMISKFAIDFYLGDIETGFYNFIFLPANALYLLQYLISRPLLTPLSELYNNDYVEYKKRASKIVFYSIFVCVGMMVIGIIFSGLYLDIDNIITNNIYIDFSKGSRIFLFNILLGGGFYSFYVMLYYMLVIERQKNRMLMIYIVLSVVALLLSTVLTGRYGLFGASLSFAIIMFILSMTLMILHFLALRKEKIND